MKAETEGYNEDEEQNSELSDSLEDFYEHDNEDAQLYGELREVRCQIDPRTGYQE